MQLPICWRWYSSFSYFPGERVECSRLLQNPSDNNCPSADWAPMGLANVLLHIPRNVSQLFQCTCKSQFCKAGWLLLLLINSQQTLLKYEPDVKTRTWGAGWNNCATVLLCTQTQPTLQTLYRRMDTGSPRVEWQIGDCAAMFSAEISVTEINPPPHPQIYTTPTKTWKAFGLTTQLTFLFSDGNLHN